MAGPDGIGDIYRIQGVTAAGGGYAFTRLRVRRSPQKPHQENDESRSEEEREDLSSPEKDSSSHVDIEA